MSINVACISCGDKLKSSGGLLFSPPDQDGLVRKDHLCGICYDAIEVVLTHPDLKKHKKDKHT